MFVGCRYSNVFLLNSININMGRFIISMICTFVAVVCAQDNCGKSLSSFISCMKNELVPSDVDKEEMCKMVQMELSDCFTKNKCIPPTFNQSLDTVFPSAVPAFVDQIKTVFSKMLPETKQCLIEQTIGKIMGNCNLNEKWQMALYMPSKDKPKVTGVFGQLASRGNAQDFQDMQDAMKKMFVLKFHVIRAVRTCQDTDATNGAKTEDCIKNHCLNISKAVCPVVKQCVAANTATTECREQFVDFRQTMCECHKQPLQDAMNCIDKATKDKTATNAQLCKMIADGLHLQDMIDNARTCFKDPSIPGAAAFTMISNFFTSPDAEKMMNNLNVREMLATAKDMLSAMSYTGTEFCQDPCKVANA